MAKVPSIGRTVHVVREHPTRQGEVIHLPGIVIAPGEADGVIEAIGLMTWTQYTTVYDRPYDPTGTRIGSWHWPEYVPETED